jgi:hypothetical protein
MKTLQPLESALLGGGRQFLKSRSKFQNGQLTDCAQAPYRKLASGGLRQRNARHAKQAEAKKL